MRNTFALRGIVDDLQNLEQQYTGLNDGRELPLRPRPYRSAVGECLVVVSWRGLLSAAPLSLLRPKHGNI
jgi:hypothetical protein